MSDQPLTPEDVACLRMLAGANFLGGEVVLPSGRVLTTDEMQALTSAYAPAAGSADEPKVWVHPDVDRSDDMTVGLIEVCENDPRPIAWKVLPTYAESERHMSWWRRYLPRWRRR